MDVDMKESKEGDPHFYSNEILEKWRDALGEFTENYTHIYTPGQANYYECNNCLGQNRKRTKEDTVGCFYARKHDYTHLESDNAILKPKNTYLTMCHKCQTVRIEDKRPGQICTERLSSRDDFHPLY